ncbi:hypothetical protein G7Y89_g1313 [Cudoniella acicularis]|uniref:MARVEL domain-containing protein n=1 Tax=Cudoniella acicularis TaxID=354080 RepID=A0A8H4RXI1_9HELO|nr:hypothetical protein G7Y89_g1313 [Cudoniella acicularis]
MADHEQKSFERQQRRVHHVPLPKWFVGVRIAQIVLAILCAGLAAYVTKNLPWLETSDLMVFTGFCTAVAILYFILTTFFFPALYIYWIVLLFEILFPLFWAPAFLALAFEIAIVTEATHVATEVEDDITAKYLGHEFSIDLFKHTKLAGDAACVLAAILFILCCMNFVTFSLRLRRFRKDGGKCFKARYKGSPQTVYNPATGDMEKQVQMGTQPMEGGINEYQKNGVIYTETPELQM